MDWRLRARETFKLVWLDTRNEWRTRGTRRTHRGRKKPVKTQMRRMDRRPLFLLFAKIRGSFNQADLSKSLDYLWKTLYKIKSFFQCFILTKIYFRNPINSLFSLFHVTVKLRISGWLDKFKNKILESEIFRIQANWKVSLILATFLQTNLIIKFILNTLLQNKRYF